MKMYSAVAILALVGMSLSSSIWAGTTTEGLTGVSVAVTGNTTVGFDYEFTVFNNSLDAYTSWDVLVGELNIYNVVAGTLAPTSVLAPAGWDYGTNGTWKDNTFISYDADNNAKYYSPPSIAPGASLSRFVLHYDSLYDRSDFSFRTHVFAVEPLTGPITDPQYYDGMKVCLNSGIYSSNLTGKANTWWDKPLDVVRTEQEAVPEASAVTLGALGLLGPMGYALKRKRVFK